MEPVLNKAPIGKSFKKNAKLVTEHLTSLAENELDELEKSLNEKGLVFAARVFNDLLIPRNLLIKIFLVSGVWRHGF